MSPAAAAYSYHHPQQGIPYGHGRFAGYSAPVSSPSYAFSAFIHCKAAAEEEEEAAAAAAKPPAAAADDEDCDDGAMTRDKATSGHGSACPAVLKVMCSSALVMGSITTMLLLLPLLLPAPLPPPPLELLFLPLLILLLLLCLALSPRHTPSSSFYPA